MYCQDGESRFHFWGRWLLSSLTWHYLPTNTICTGRQAAAHRWSFCKFLGVHHGGQYLRWSPRIPASWCFCQPLSLGVVRPTDSLLSSTLWQMWWSVSSEDRWQKDGDFHLACSLSLSLGVFSLQETSCHMWAAMWEPRPRATENLGSVTFPVTELGTNPSELGLANTLMAALKQTLGWRQPVKVPPNSWPREIAKICVC